MHSVDFLLNMVVTALIPTRSSGGLANGACQDATADAENVAFFLPDVGKKTNPKRYTPRAKFSFVW
jgi:hypothetical protein